MNVELLAEQHLEFLSFKGGCTGWSESTLVKMPHCWKSHVMAHLRCEEILQWCKSDPFMYTSPTTMYLDSSDA